MDTSFWKTTKFYDEKFPEWTCPTCERASLKVEKIHSEFDAYTKNSQSHSEWDIEHTRFVFWGALHCNNSNCGEVVVFTGKGGKIFRYWHDHNGKELETLDEYFVPTTFNPPLKLFKITTDCPDEVKDEIIAAFNLYWGDLASCANKIRIALEAIMSDKGIESKAIDRHGKERWRSADEKIRDFTDVYSDLKQHEEFLHALRWIGNSGSHFAEIKNEDLLDGFELLEFVINKVYDGTEKRLNNISKTITGKKGPRFS